MLEIRELPEVELGADMSLCEGETTTINAPSQLTEYSWEDGSEDMERTISNSGIYWLEAVENNCPNRDSISIQFNTLPQISLGQDTTVCSDQGYTLQATGSNGTITWHDGTTGSEYLVTSPGLISATIDDGCMSDASVNIAFRECVYFKMYLPNAFRPTSTKGNSFFKPSIASGVQVISYNMTVYNRWGGEVFSTQSPTEGWNGYVDNQDSKSSVYVYRVQITYQDDNGIGQTTVSGDVLLVE